MSLLNISNLHQPLKLFYDSDASNYIKIQSPNNLTSNYTLTLPENHGIANQILKIDSSQKLYWDSVGLSISNIPNSVVEGDLTIGDDNNNILIIESKLNIPLGETGQVLTKQSNGLIEFNDRLYPDYQFYFIKGKSQSFTIQTGTHSFISSQTKWQWDKDTSSSIKSSSPSLLTWNSDTEFRFNKIGIYKITIDHGVYSNTSHETSDMKCIMSDSSNNSIISFSQHFIPSSSGNNTNSNINNSIYIEITSTTTAYRWSAGSITNNGVYHNQQNTYFTSELIYGEPIIITPGTGSNSGSGGIETQYTTVDNITYKIHTFLSSGTFILSSGSIDIDYLIVGGGGGGASRHGGGGGAGGVVIGISQTINTGNFPIIIGNGGAGLLANGSGYGSDGIDSTFNSFIASGGGGGASSGAGNIGGSGGGRRGNTSGSGGASDQNTYSSTSNVTGYGNSGGTVNNNSYGGSGGGGAGSAGITSNGTNGSNGGIGIQNSFKTGINVYYGGGGSGGGSTGGGSGGDGGGGNGGGGSYNSSTFGSPNTGGGGGAGGHGSSNYPGKLGGSGIVVIRYVK